MRSGPLLDASDLLKDWRSQLKPDLVLKTHELGVPLVALCRGNELREYLEGEPPNWKFTRKIATALCKLLSATQSLIHEHGFDTPVTYAMEGLGLDSDGKLLEDVVPIVETMDIYSVNYYPMEAEDWFTESAFERNRRFLRKNKEAHLRLARFEHGLHCLLEELEKHDRPLILSETGLHGGIGFRKARRDEGQEMAIEARDGEAIVPVQDAASFEKVYLEFASIIQKMGKDYPNRIRGGYIYEWRDNPYHSKIKTENSPVHACFGLCYVDGTPKFDLSKLTSILKRP